MTRDNLTEMLLRKWIEESGRTHPKGIKGKESYLQEIVRNLGLTWDRENDLMTSFYNLCELYEEHGFKEGFLSACDVMNCIIGGE